MGILNTIKSSLFEWRELLVCALPDSYMGRKLRSIHYAMKFGRKAFPLTWGYKSFPMICRMTKIYGDKNLLFLGSRFQCGEYVEINFCKSRGIYIGNDVLMARGTYIRAGNHNFDRFDIPIYQQGHDSAAIKYRNKEYSIVIEDNVWIGANAIVLSGAKIGTGSIVAAGSVVTGKEFPPNSIIAGNPARVIKTRVPNGGLHIENRLSNNDLFIT